MHLQTCFDGCAQSYSLVANHQVSESGTQFQTTRHSLNPACSLLISSQQIVVLQQTELQDARLFQ